MQDLRSRHPLWLLYHLHKGKHFGWCLILALPLYSVAQKNPVIPPLEHLRQTWYSKDKKVTDAQRLEAGLYLMDWYQFFSAHRQDSLLIIAQEMVAYGKQTKNAELIVEGVNKIGRYHYQQGDIRAAIRTYREALLQPGLKDSNKTYRLYGNLGLAYGNLDQLDSAAYYLKQALASGRKHDHTAINLGSMYGNLANVYELQGKYLDAIDGYTQVLNTGDLSHQFQAAMAIGGIFETLGLRNEAKASYQQAEVIARKSNKKNTQLKNYAAQLAVSENLAEAERLIRKGLALHDSFGLKRPTLILFLSAGTLYLDSLQLDQATDFYQRALALAIKIEDKGSKNDALLALAKIHQLQGRTQESMQICQEIKAPLEKKHNPGSLATLYALLSKNYETLQQPAQALFYLRQKEAQEALLKDKENIQVALSTYIQRKSERERKALQLAKNNAEKLAVAVQAKAQLNYRILGLISLGLMGAVGAYYSFYRQKKSTAEHLSALNQSLELEKIKLTRANAKLRRFSGIVSHDILSNLDLILSTGNVLVGARPNPQSLSQYYTMTQATSRQLKDYCLGLLADARSAQKADLAPEEWTDPMPVLHRVLARFGHELRAAGVEVDLQELSSAPLPAVLMEQVFQNLVSNTLRHGATAQQARLVIREDKDQQGQVRWIIEDNGPGIAPERREMIFGPGQEGSSAGQQVGLSLLRETLREQGADIRVETAAEGGARWIVAMP